MLYSAATSRLHTVTSAYALRCVLLLHVLFASFYFTSVLLLSLGALPFVHLLFVIVWRRTDDFTIIVSAKVSCFISGLCCRKINVNILVSWWDDDIMNVPSTSSGLCYENWTLSWTIHVLAQYSDASVDFRQCRKHHISHNNQ